MDHSEQINELAAALATARKAFGTFSKDKAAKIESSKGGYAYKYGDLSNLFDATTAALSDNGLTLSQWPDIAEGGQFVLVTWLLHSSGQWMSSQYPLETYARPQEQGSALTYAKRYAAGAALGIAAEVDDDGAAAQQSQPKPPAGYEQWALDLAAVADEGLPAFQQAWKDSPPAFRTYRMTHEASHHETLKKKAAAVKVPA